jgi:hypothetical protein
MTDEDASLVVAHPALRLFGRNQSSAKHSHRALAMSFHRVTGDPGNGGKTEFDAQTKVA